MIINGRPPSDRAWAMLGDAAIKAVALLNIVHSLTSTLFGVGLVVSAVLELEALSPAYSYLEAIPAWPLSMGLVFLVTGIAQLIFRRSERTWRWACWSFVVQATAASVYSAFFLYGAFSGPTWTLIGPQFLYAGLAMSAAAHALWMHRAYLITHEP